MGINEFIIFYICLFAVIIMQIPNLILGNVSDCYFSEKTIEKLTVPKNSILRKLVIFKESKNANPPFLYIRVIPYLIQLVIIIISTMLMLVNQFIINFMPEIIFVGIGFASLCLNVIYDLILVFLSRGLKL